MNCFSQSKLLYQFLKVGYVSLCNPCVLALANSFSLEFSKYFSIPYIGTILCTWLGLEVKTKPQSGFFSYGYNRFSYSTPKYVQSICENYIEIMPSSIKLLLDYSAHLYEARKYFEALREQKPGFSDFLSRCSHTNFSKRLDLWHFLECPKTRLTRYPLLLDRLIKLTPSTDPELNHLLVVRSAFTCIAEELNRRIGEAMRNFYLEYIEFHGNLELQYKDMICHQKSLLLRGNLHTGIGEVTVFIFPQLMLITASTGPDRNTRLISHCYPGKLSRQTTNLRGTTSSKNSPTLPISALPSIISSMRTSVCSHRWSLLSILKSPPNSENSMNTSFNSGNRPSKYTRLFRRLSSIITMSSSSSSSSWTRSEVSKLITTASFTPAHETVSLERFHICYPPIILKDYVLENVTDDNIPSSVLKFPFSIEKTHQNVFKLSYYDYCVKRKSGKTAMKQSNLLYSCKKILSKTSREINWFSSSPSLSQKSNKTLFKEFLFEASSLEDKKFWLSTLAPLVRSYHRS
ncbi:unnamed protein product [Schistosoma turkestanicum]|nr:unnamed protein product [Schistosoma turkestanicum]